MAQGRKKQPRQFGAYAKMEAANVLLVPGFALWLARPDQTIEVVTVALSIIACSGLLVVGALYWWGLDSRLRGRGRSSLDRALRVADIAQRPLLFSTGVAAATTLVAAVVEGLIPGVLAAAALTLLAALEYVNYYHRQLQHFDNKADFKRLLSGRGARPSHMARDLAVYRKNPR